MEKNTSSKQYKRPYILYISSQEVKILFTILNIYSRHNSSPNSGIWFSPMAILLLTLEFGSVPCQIFSPLWNCFSPSTILLPTEIWFPWQLFSPLWNLVQSHNSSHHSRMLFSPMTIIFITKPGGIQWSIPLYSLFLSCSLKFKSNFFVFINFFPTRPWCHLFAIISRGTSPLITCRGLFSFQVYLSKRFAIWRRFTVWFCGLPMGEWELERQRKNLPNILHQKSLPAEHSFQGV